MPPNIRPTLRWALAGSRASEHAQADGHKLQARRLHHELAEGELRPRLRDRARLAHQRPEPQQRGGPAFQLAALVHGTSTKIQRVRCDSRWLAACKACLVLARCSFVFVRVAAGQIGWNWNEPRWV